MAIYCAALVHSDSQTNARQVPPQKKNVRKIDLSHWIKTRTNLELPPPQFEDHSAIMLFHCYLDFVKKLVPVFLKGRYYALQLFLEGLLYLIVTWCVLFLETLDAKCFVKVN